MKTRQAKKVLGSDYWDAILTESKVIDSEELWRSHMKELYRTLDVQWGGKPGSGRILKTDLYDEAISSHNLVPLLERQSEKVVGIDVSFQIASSAKQRLNGSFAGTVRTSIAVTDTRNLAFRSMIFDSILSNSTLDHFPDKRDIVRSLRELGRVLRPGGVLTITLDNPWNPVVFLRNHLPCRLMRLLKLIPFYMGKTLSGPELVRTLEKNGFNVLERKTLAHFPRIIALRVASVLPAKGGQRTRDRFQNLLCAFEYLERLPTRYLTGYYVAVKAVKR